MAGVNAINGKTDKVAFNPNDIGGKKNNKTAGAFLAQVQITKDDFSKKGYVAPPGLTEGGSAFTQV